MVKVVAVIPSRYNSARFPGKSLALIHGKPMVVHVLERAQQIEGVSDVIVATDNLMIASTVQMAGGKASITSDKHESGTDRVAETMRGAPKETIVLNVQGDMPFVDPCVCNLLVECLKMNPDVDVATPAIIEDATNARDFYNRNVVKVVFDLKGRALYFSRKSIPDISDCIRELPSWHRHIGIYAYRNKTLQAITNQLPSSLELYERLEQLRMLEHGFNIRVVLTNHDCGVDVNCPQDIEKII